MRLAVFSDVHGNLPALEAVLNDLEHEKVDGYIVAGDYNGCPQGNEALRLIRALSPSWVIRGNAEQAEVAFREARVPDAWNTSKQFAHGRWLHAHLDQDSYRFIAALPAQAVCALPGTAPIRIVHGSPRATAEHLYPDRDPVKMELFRRAGFPWGEIDPISVKTALSEIEEDYLVCGHTHISWQQSEVGKLAINPGAVSGASERDTLAHYALLIWNHGTWQVKHRAISYDLARLRATFRESGLLEAGGVMARCVLMSCETGENVVWHFMGHAKRLADAAGIRGYTAFPDEILDRAEATFDWGQY